jgi:hypothetical protein
MEEMERIGEREKGKNCKMLENKNQKTKPTKHTIRKGGMDAAADGVVVASSSNCRVVCLLPTTRGNSP